MKSKVKNERERENHNITPLLRLKSQTSRSMITFQVEADCMISGIFRRPSIFNSFVVKDVFKFFQLAFDKVEDFVKAPKAS